MDKIFTFFLPSPVGLIRIDWNDQGIFRTEIYAEQPDLSGFCLQDNEAIIADFEGYFADSQHRFTTKLNPIGSMFQLAVWQALQQIQVGDVVTYGALAKSLSTSAQAVGNACRMNPLPILIPCHRMVAVNDIGGYMGHSDGAMIKTKHWLLLHEGIAIDR